MTAKHTPGPWTYSENGSSIWSPHDRPDFRKVAEAHGSGLHDLPETRANGRLIAAAPDLLESVKNLESFIMAVPGEDARRLRAEARAAIARAERR